MTKNLFKLLLVAALALAPWASDAQVFNQWPANQATLTSAIAPATPAVATIKASAGVITHIACFNILATPVYVKVWDAASPTLGTTAATYQFMCPGNTAGAGFVASFNGWISFATAIKFAVTGAISTTDNTAITANSVIVNIAFN
jgi:hypothetical protein